VVGKNADGGAIKGASGGITKVYAHKNVTGNVKKMGNDAKKMSCIFRKIKPLLPRSAPAL
jgi:hypothetical protein